LTHDSRLRRLSFAKRQQSRLFQVAAWVGIVAGIVFIVAVVFGTGFFLGARSDGGYHHRGHGDRPGIMMFDRGGPPMGPGRGMMPPFGPGGPFGEGPFGQGPDGQGGPGVRQAPPDRPETTAPARP